MFKRNLDITEVIKRKSLFIFGPRQTGKSTYLKSNFTNTLYINLLNLSEYQNFLNNSKHLRERVKYFLNTQQKNSQSIHIIIIDEIQKLPQLLDEVHDLIEENKSLRFILTGSSARKLKRSGVNLLGGRASWFDFYGLNYYELGENKNTLWLETLSKGKLPAILTSTDYYADLKDYIGLYLKEEIQAEGLTRSIENFSRFLSIASLVNAEQINYTSLAEDVQLKPSLVRDYFEILTDTLIGHTLNAFNSTKKRKAMASNKFYLFDCGVSAALANRNEIAFGTPEFGKQFEQAIFIELKNYLSYSRSHKKLEYWRSTSKFEVDFLIYENLNEIIGIEVKSTKKTKSSDYKGLLAFEEDFILKRKIIVCFADHPYMTESNIEVIPVQDFLEALWNGQLI